MATLTTEEAIIESAAATAQVLVNYTNEKTSMKLDKPEDTPEIGKILKIKVVNDDGSLVCEWGDTPSAVIENNIIKVT